MSTRTNAVLVATAQTEIAVPLATIWKLQTDIDRWPTWQRDIAYARLEGPLQAGTLFRWKAMGLSIVSRLEAVVPMSRLGMTEKIRDRVYEVSMTDPVKTTIMGAELFVTPTSA